MSISLKNIHRKKTNTLNAKLTERLVRFRKEIAQLSQEDIAKELGIKRATYAKYELHIANIPNDVILFLNRNYQLNFEWFFNGVGSLTQKEDKKIMHDISSIHSDIKFLSERIKLLETNMRKIYRDYYDKE